jgi:hypothetical protein
VSTPQFHDHDSDVPDVTHAVMSRLGFERVSPSIARSSRRRNRLIRGTMFSLALLIALAAGLHERISIIGSGTDDSVLRNEPGRSGRAQIFTGLLAPFEELERLLDHTETCETVGTGALVDSELIHGPSQGGEYIPLLEDSGPFTTFPCS